VDNNNKIALNTVIMFIRMIFVMLITLFTVRVTIQKIGVEDYGIYNVVAGFISMLSVISGSLEAATQRFFSYSLGEKNTNRINTIFNLSLLTYIVLSIIIILLSETIGIWFINNYLQIPTDRMNAINWIYQFAILNVFFMMISLPFSSLLIANEKMKEFALISIIENILKLIILYLIALFNFDKLIVFAFLLTIVGIIKLLIYIYVSKRLYSNEIKLKFIFDKQIFKELISYSGWTFYGSLSGVANIQGNNLLLNIFFGPLANAAQAVAFQVSNAVSSFCNNIFVVFRPPIVKSYADKDILNVMNLFYLSSRMSLYLMILIFVPLYIETDFILELWLKNTSEYMSVFTKLILIYTLIITQHNPVTTIVQATGKIKNYFLIVESVTLLSLPLTYIFFKIGLPAETTFYISIIIFLIAHLIRIYIMSKLIKFSLRKYLKSVIFPAFTILAISLIFSSSLKFVINDDLMRLISVTLLATTTTLLSIYLIGLTKLEKFIVKDKLQSIIKK